MSWRNISRNQAQPADWPMRAAAVLLLLVAAACAFYLAFSRSLSLDEGYVMISVKGFLNGQPLYDSVFTQYGPFFYLYHWIIHKVLGVPLTHDATRLLCMFHWLAASTVLAVAARTMTRSTFAGLLVFMQSVVHLAPLADEPGHPQEVVALLLALAFLLATRDVNKSLGFEGLALVGAMLLFTKINVGIFFGAALLVAVGLHSSIQIGRSPWRWIVIAGCAAMPFLLMQRHIMNEPWRNYALVMAVSVITATLLSQEAATKLVNVSRYRKLMIVFAVTVVALMALPIFTGTSVRGLADGFIRGPLLTPAVATWALRVSNLDLFSAAASLVTCFFVWLNTRHPHRSLIVTSLKGLIGAVGAIFLVSGADAQLKYLLPWVWLVLASGSKDREWEGTFPRVFLCLMAAWQGLQAYPIARTQVSIATFPMILVLTVCLWDAVTAMRIPERFREWFNARRRSLVLRVAASAALVCFFAIAWCKLPRLHSYYGDLPSLNLPGARLVRTDSETTQSYQKLAQYLNANSDTFLMCPGLNSFYFWASKEPPAYFNSTTLALLTERQLTQVLAALGRHERRLILVSEDVPIDWLRDSSAPASLLARTLESEYAATDHLSKFVIYAPKKLPEPAIGSR